MADIADHAHADPIGGDRRDMRRRAIAALAVLVAVSVAAAAAIFLGWNNGVEIPFTAAMKLMKWYPLLTLPMFIFMGYVLSESRIADDLYRMFHVWMGPVRGYTEREVRTRGLDLVVCLDTSRSMLSRDVRPSRIDRARREVRGLLDQLAGDRPDWWVTPGRLLT